MSRKQITSRWLCAAWPVPVVALVCVSGLAAAADVPDKVHFLIPGSAGSVWDSTARGTAEVLTKSGLLKQVSFDNMSGNGGGQAIAHLIETAGRGHDTLMVSSTEIILGSLRGRFPQSFRDLIPIASVIGDYGAFVVPAGSIYNSFGEVAEAWQADPNSIKVAGGSVRGGVDHLVAALAFQAAGADPGKVNYIAYDAGEQAIAGLLAGESQVLSTGLGEALLHAKAGHVRIIGVTAGRRIKAAPQTPTLKEQGFNVEFVNWRGYFGAPGVSESRADSFAKLLGWMFHTAEWDAVRRQNAWVNNYRPGKQFTALLDQQETVLKGLLNKLGIQTVR